MNDAADAAFDGFIANADSFMVEVNQNVDTKGLITSVQKDFRQTWHQGNPEDWTEWGGPVFVESNTSLPGHGYDAVRRNYEAATGATSETRDPTARQKLTKLG